MKAIKIVYNDIEGNLISPKCLFGKIISEDEHFLNFLTGHGKSYRINKKLILTIEESSREFILNEEVRF